MNSVNIWRSSGIFNGIWSKLGFWGWGWGLGVGLLGCWAVGLFGVPGRQTTLLELLLAERWWWTSSAIMDDKHTTSIQGRGGVEGRHNLPPNSTSNWNSNYFLSTPFWLLNLAVVFGKIKPQPGLEVNLKEARVHSTHSQPYLHTCGEKDEESEKGEESEKDTEWEEAGSTLYASEEDFVAGKLTGNRGQ